MNLDSWLFVTWFFLVSFTFFFMAGVLVVEFIIDLMRDGMPVLCKFIFKRIR